jgi:hypothetical protein
MSSTSAWKLRRLAPRAKRVQARRAGDAPVLAVFAQTLPVKADAFIIAYDAAAKYVNAWRREMKEGKGAVAKLVSDIRSWLPLLARDIPEFDPSSFADKPGVPDDVFEDGNRLLEIVAESTNAQGKPVDYAAAATTAITDSLAAANKEWSEAEAADSKYQELLRNVRATGAVFDLELQTFRRSLSNVAGRNDKDFQKLRAERASHNDDEDDPDAPAPPAPVTPAAKGNSSSGT